MKQLLAEKNLQPELDYLSFYRISLDSSRRDLFFIPGILLLDDFQLARKKKEEGPQLSSDLGKERCLHRLDIKQFVPSEGSMSGRGVLISALWLYSCAVQFTL